MALALMINEPSVSPLLSYSDRSVSSASGRITGYRTRDCGDLPAPSQPILLQAISWRHYAKCADDPDGTRFGFNPAGEGCLLQELRNGLVVERAVLRALPIGAERSIGCHYTGAIGPKLGTCGRTGGVVFKLSESSLLYSAIYHSSRVSIGKVKHVFCFSIVRGNQANGISTAGTLHGQVRRDPSGKRSFVELPIMEARIIAHSAFIGYCITPVNL